MDGKHDKSPLPHVSDEDIAVVLFEEIVDPTHRARFDHISQTNPELMREIVRRAYIDAYTTLGFTEHALIPTLDIQQVIIDNVTFALSALEQSMEKSDTAIASDDASGEDRPHSSEPGGDPPIE